MCRTLLGLTAVCFALAAAPAGAQDPLLDYKPVEQAPILDSPEAGESSYSGTDVERGRYLVDLLGCSGCHTDGALSGNPDPDRVLAGSAVGIAISNPMQMRKPGVVFPSNLTPDPETGLGNWGLEEIVMLLTSGVDNHGEQTLPVMPWLTYARLTQDDATAIGKYLQSIPAVRHQVPDNVRPGKSTKEPFVHFGVYQSRQ